jgi:hypothetical protein
VGDNGSSTTTDKVKDASLTTVKTCLCINNSNDAIVMRAIITIGTMAKKRAHQRQQSQLANKQ